MPHTSVAEALETVLGHSTYSPLIDLPLNDDKKRRLCESVVIRGALQAALHQIHGYRWLEWVKDQSIDLADSGPMMLKEMSDIDLQNTRVSEWYATPVSEAETPAWRTTRSSGMSMGAWPALSRLATERPLRRRRSPAPVSPTVPGRITAAAVSPI